jgi:hypothetical protein
LNFAVIYFVAMMVGLIGSCALIVVQARRLPALRLARQKAIAALCAQRGLVPGAVAADFVMLGAFAPRWLTNSFSSPDHTVAVTDFIRPADKTTQFFTVLAFSVAGVNVPYVAVTVPGETAVGGPPKLDLESIEFDQRFTVKAKDRRSAVMLLDPGMMQLLLDCKQVSFHMAGDKVLAFINRAAEPAHQPTEPVEFEQLFRFYDGFVARMPELCAAITLRSRRSTWKLDRGVSFRDPGREAQREYSGFPRRRSCYGKGGGPQLT